MPKRLKSRSKFLKKVQTHLSVKPSKTTFLLLITGLTIILISLGWNYYQSRVLSFSSFDQNTLSQQEIKSLPKKLQIPDLNINLEIKPTQIKNETWEINSKGASYLINSGYPGTAGNIIIYGHNKKSLLGSLKMIKKGQVINIITADSKIYQYKVSNIMTVNPNQIEVLYKTEDETLTLYTCTGFLDSKRLIIQAKRFN